MTSKEFESWIIKMAYPLGIANKVDKSFKRIIKDVWRRGYKAGQKDSHKINDRSTKGKSST